MSGASPLLSDELIDRLKLKAAALWLRMSPWHASPSQSSTHFLFAVLYVPPNSLQTAALIPTPPRGFKWTFRPSLYKKLLTGKLMGPLWAPLFPLLLLWALCSCQRRKSTVFDNDQLAEHAAGRFVRRRRKWPGVNGNNRKSLEQQLGSLLLPSSIYVFVTGLYHWLFWWQYICKTRPISGISQTVDWKILKSDDCSWNIRDFVVRLLLCWVAWKKYAF